MWLLPSASAVSTCATNVSLPCGQSPHPANLNWTGFPFFACVEHDSMPPLGIVWSDDCMCAGIHQRYAIVWHLRPYNLSGPYSHSEPCRRRIWSTSWMLKLAGVAMPTSVLLCDLRARDLLTCIGAPTLCSVLNCLVVLDFVIGLCVWLPLSTFSLREVGFPRQVFHLLPLLELLFRL